MLRRFLGFDRLGLLSSEARRLIVVFTIVETIILSLWLDALGVNIGVDLLPTNGVLSVGILFSGLLIEHLIAGVSGKA